MFHFNYLFIAFAFVSHLNVLVSVALVGVGLICSRYCSPWRSCGKDRKKVKEGK